MKNLFTLFIRRIFREKLISGIQILSLVLANTAGIIGLMYVLDELSYDRFHERKDRVYKVISDISDAKTGEIDSRLETVGWPLGKTLLDKFPEVEKVVYARSGAALQVNWEDERVQENVHYASQDFLSMFSFPIVSGDPETALEEPYSIVISKEISEKYFPGEMPLGKTLLMGDSLNMMVTGVVEVPENSHIQFGILVSFSTYETLNRSWSYVEGWGNFNVRNYIMLSDGVNPGSFMAKARTIYMDEIGEQLTGMGISVDVGFVPVEDIYLHSDRGNGWGPLGSLDRVKLVAAISLVTILLACINFVNLSTARSVFRAKEVGLRKVIGGTRRSIAYRFMIESLVFTSVSFLISLFSTYLVLPLFNNFIGKNYTLASLLQFEVIVGLVVVVLLIALMSGSYPATVLSSFRPAEILKGRFQSGQRGVNLRRSLVVVQFFMCSALIVAMLLISRQVNFMKESPLGFDKEQLITLDLRSVSNINVQSSYENVLNDLRSLPMLDQISFSAALPGRSGWDGQWAFGEGMAEGENVSVHYIPIDHQFIRTMKMDLIAGSDYSLDRSTDLDDGLIVNERTVELMGWQEPDQAIGKTIDSPSGYPRGRVIGVIRNYNQYGLQKEIQPLVLDHYTLVSKYIIIRYNQTNTADMISSLEGIWNKHYPEHEFNYFFVDENFEQQYRSEEKVYNIFSMFSFIGICIAIIGLFGLISFLIVTRTKEIGVRKILGASNMTITTLMMKEFIVLVVISNLLIVPLAWIYGNKWLETFAYHTTMGLGPILGALFLTLFLAIFTIGYQAIKAGRMNPSDSLRME